MYFWDDIDEDIYRLVNVLTVFSGGAKTVVVTGATGLIGTALTKSLQSRGFTVRKLTTSAKKGDDDFSWDPKAGSIGDIMIKIKTKEMEINKHKTVD